MEWREMAESLLQDIRRDGYHVGTVEILDRENGETLHMINATDAKTGEKWTVMGRDRLERKWS